MKNEYMRLYMKERARKRVAAAKEQLGGKCVRCGSVDDLQFDHIDPTTKLFTLAKGSSFSEERWQAEVEKCQLLCQACHTAKTLEDLGRLSAKDNHGTLSCYTHAKCRCELCKQARRDYQRKWRHKGP